MLRAAHGKEIVAFLVDTLAWVARGAGTVLRGSPAPLSTAAEQFIVIPPPTPMGTRWPFSWGDMAKGWRRGPR